MTRILIVEDEADIRNMLADALRLRHHIVDCARNAASALQLSETNSYDVAIVDYVLPGMRGLDLLQELRRTNPFVRSIIISGEIDHDALDRAEVERQLKEKIAADHYLAKPVTGDSLLQAIDEVLQPLSGKQIDWKQVAANAITTSRVKKKDVREVDKTLIKNRKKR